MKAKIYPLENQVTSLRAKSSSFCMLLEIIGAILSKGTTKIYNATYSEEINTVIEWGKLFGATFKKSKDNLIIKGKKGNLSINESLLECPTANVAKLFIPFLTTLNKPIGIKGTKKVLDDLKQYQQIYEDYGITCYFDEEIVRFEKIIRSRSAEIDGDCDIYFIAGLFIALPLLSNKSEIKLIAPIREERSYKTITKILRRFHIDIKHPSTMRYEINGFQHYHGCEINTDSDEFMLSHQAMLIYNANQQQDFIKVENYYKGNCDASRLFEYLKKDIINYRPYRSVIKKKQLNSERIELSIENSLPFLMVIATLRNNESTIYHIDFSKQRLKEQYDIMSSVFSKLGLEFSDLEDEIYIQPKKVTQKVQVDCKGDPYVVMAISLLAMVSCFPIVIRNAECIYNIDEDFFVNIRNIGVKVDLIDG